MAGLYLHLPFCARKCTYCDFYSLPLGDFPNLGKTITRFFQALEKELAALPPDFAPDTIYIGGGTPTALSAAQLDELLALVRRRVHCDAVREWTVEANPGTLDAAKADALRCAGVNRVSLGVQSLNDDALKRIGRIHTAAEARTAFDVLRAAGFDNVSVDLMYALPGETAAQVLADLRGLLAWRPEHLSTYALAIEPGTPLAAQRARGEIAEVPDEEQAEQYHAIRRELLAAGFEHYELSNFARPGRACRHNLNYWRGGEYHAGGPAAHAHSAGRRSANIEDLEAYCRRLEQNSSPREFEEQLAPEAKARETLIIGLRLLAGVDRAAFRQQTGFDALALGGAALEQLIAQGLLEVSAENLRLTERALFISNRVFAELV
jgi:oxygen-independent coproporphyrinogen-3 oxidase